MFNSLLFLFFLALAAAPALALWAIPGVPVQFRALLVTAVLFICSSFVIARSLKILGMNYDEIGLRLPRKETLKRDALLLVFGTSACLLWLRLYFGAFKMLLPAEYARLEALKYSGYIQFLAEWGRTGGFPGAAALCCGTLLLVAIEELAFRGVIFNYLRREHTYKEALIWSSALFTLAHLNPHNFPITFVVGLIFALLYVKSGGLVVPIFAHLAYNLSVIYFGKYLH